MSDFRDRRQSLGPLLRKLPPVENGGPPLAVDALLVCGLASVRYLTGFTGSSGMVLLFPSGDAILFTDPRYGLQSRQEVNCRRRVAKGQILERVARECAKARLRRLGFEAGRLGFSGHAFLRSKLPRRTELTPLEGVVEERRMIKDSGEVACIRRSVLTNSGTFRDVLRQIRPGRMSEMDLAAEIEYRMRRRGAEKPAFDTIVANGARSALPHARPTRAILRQHELLLIDMGSVQDGYASDMTRVVALGRVSGAKQSLYHSVREAQEAALDAVRPGVTAGSVDRAARVVLRAHGLDKTFVHSTGHGLGLEIHEPPRLGKKEKTRLAEGMTITIEPGAYVEGVGGVRIEDTVLVTRSGCEILTPTSKDLLEL